MKFLFYIAYLVCVSSLPISSLPERHLKPINQSLLGLSNGGFYAVLHNHECGAQVKQLGYYNPQGATDDLKKKDCKGGSSSDCPSTPEECASMVEEDDDCPSGLFMWSDSYPVWGCRCCTNAKETIQHNLWTLYATTASAVQNDVECGKQVKNYGATTTADECALKVEEDDDCSSGVFMWSSSYPVWGCRCCTNAENPIQHDLWNLYVESPIGYTIEIRRPQTYTGGNKHHLHIREIEAFDVDNQKCQLWFRGRAADASPLMNPGKKWNNVDLTPKLCIDGDKATMNHNDYGGSVQYNSEELFMHFEILCEKSINIIKIYNRNQGKDDKDKLKMAERLSSSELKLKGASDGALIASHTISKQETDKACCGVDESIDWCLGDCSNLD